MAANDEFPRGWIGLGQNAAIGVAAGAQPIALFQVPAVPGITHVATRFDLLWSLFSVSAAWGGSGLTVAAAIQDGTTLIWQVNVDVYVPAGTGAVTPSGLQVPVLGLPDKVSGTVGQPMTFGFFGSNAAFSGVVTAAIAGHDV